MNADVLQHRQQMRCLQQQRWEQISKVILLITPKLHRLTCCGSRRYVVYSKYAQNNATNEVGA